jgi:nucleoside-diphosphate-sugar epimerase
MGKNVLPNLIETEEELDEIMSAPSGDLIELMKRLEGDIIILGVAGKIGVNLALGAVNALRAAKVDKRVIGVSRFSNPSDREKLTTFGIETIPCDLLDRTAVENLPSVPNVLFMAGRKFGTSGSEEMTWAMNTVVPAHTAHRFRESRIVAFSTGCVYGDVSSKSGGSVESDPLHPVGDYSQSTVGRERVFQYFSRKNGTPVCLIRLNYAIDLRYGVLREIGEKVFKGLPVDLITGQVNVIWQGDVINQTLLCLEHCASPAAILNMTGPETVSLRYVAREFGELFHREVVFTGEERDSVLLSNAARAADLFGYPRVTLSRMIRWIAHWIEIGGSSLNKPTHFEVRDGNY